MKKLISIKNYPSSFEITYEEENKRNVYSLLYIKGELNEEDWKEGGFISKFSKDDQEKILDYIHLHDIYAIDAIYKYRNEQKKQITNKQTNK